ncbi:MAG: hypothetical protein CW345_03375 [Firmicutes bacterium]|nr:hypothetical protein [Bacillota bacterium]MBO2520833.1 hypothetical protein [Bacillota bacterium]
MSRPSAAPLAGRRIAVLRGAGQAALLARELEVLGAEVLLVPLWRTAPPADPGALHDAAARVAAYDWVVFTSANGVHAFFDALSRTGVEEAAWRRVRFAAVGPGTARALEERGARPDLTAREHRAESLVEAMAARGMAGQRVLFPRAHDARDVLVKGLRAAKAAVDDVVAYRLLPEPTRKEQLLELGAGDTDALLLTSPSTVRFLKSACQAHGLPWPIETPCFCIGPVTAEEARQHGLHVAAVAPRYTISGLLDALVSFFSAPGPAEV